MSRYRTLVDMIKEEGLIERGTGPNNRPLCLFCGREIPPGRRKSFCGSGCRYQWDLRADSSFLRRELFKLQKGICQNCGTDTVALGKELAKLPYEERRLKMIELCIPEHRKLSSLFDMDHILPVSLGGGVELDGKPMDILATVRTLCIPCHRVVTAEMQTDLKLQRRAEKKAGKPKPPVRLLRIESK